VRWPIVLHISAPDTGLLYGSCSFEHSHTLVSLAANRCCMQLSATGAGVSPECPKSGPSGVVVQAPSVGLTCRFRGVEDPLVCRVLLDLNITRCRIVLPLDPKLFGWVLRVLGRFCASSSVYPVQSGFCCPGLLHSTVLMLLEC